LLNLKISYIPKYPKLSLLEERSLISKAKRGFPKATEELVLRHISFIVFRIYKKAFPSYIDRFGENLFSEVIFILYEKIKTYDLKYRDKRGKLKPVRFSSYIWKRIDGFIIDSLRAEVRREQQLSHPDWERFEKN